MNLYMNFGFYGQDSPSNQCCRELSQRRQMGQLFLLFNKWNMLF